METTAGVTCSAIETNALLASAIGFTSCTDGLAATVRDCAYPKRVRSKPDAKTIPLAKAITTAAPNRARASVRDDIGSGPCLDYRNVWTLSVRRRACTEENMPRGRLAVGHRQVSQSFRLARPSDNGAGRLPGPVFVGAASSDDTTQLGRVKLYQW